MKDYQFSKSLLPNSEYTFGAIYMLRNEQSTTAEDQSFWKQDHLNEGLKMAFCTNIFVISIKNIIVLNSIMTNRRNYGKKYYELILSF